MSHLDIECRAFIAEGGRIFYYWDAELQGIFILWLSTDGKPTKEHIRLFKRFLDNHQDEDIYFSTADVAYIQNHVDFHGYYGHKKVYKYAK